MINKCKEREREDLLNVPCVNTLHKYLPSLDITNIFCLHVDILSKILGRHEITCILTIT